MQQQKQNICYLIHKEITKNFADGEIVEIIRNPVVLSIKFSVEQSSRILKCTSELNIQFRSEQ